MRTRGTARSRWLLGIVPIGLLFLAACSGSTDQPGPGATVTAVPSASSVSASPSVSTPSASGTMNDASSLTLVYNNGDGDVTTWQLSCEPPGGTHVDPEAACAALGKNAAALAPVARGKMCTQIYSGPQTATLRGYYHSRLVNSTFSRRNGCETGRWKALEGLLPPITS